METVFHSLPEEKFPFTISAFRTDNDECVWSLTINTGPTTIQIPALSKQYGGVPIKIKIVYADGTTSEARP